MIIRRAVLIFVALFYLPIEANSATLSEAADWMLSTDRIEYSISNRDTGFNISYTGAGPSTWSFTENENNTIDVEVYFNVDDQVLIYRDTLFYNYEYSNDPNGDSTVWGFFPTDDASLKQLFTPIAPFQEAPLIYSGYDLYLDFTSDCAAHCEDPFPELSQVPLPASILLFLSGALGLVSINLTRRSSGTSKKRLAT